MKIVITGAKSSGKSTAGAKIADWLKIPFIETDTLIEQAYRQEYSEELSFYDICKKLGEDEFRKLEQQAVCKAADCDWCVVSTGGSTLLKPKSRALLRNNSVLVMIKADTEELWDRIKRVGKSKYLQGENAKENFKNHIEYVNEVIEPFADIVIKFTEKDNVAEFLLERLYEYFATESKSPNTLGQIVRLTTFGESHGKAIGAVLDGIAPGLPISEADIQTQLDRRRPGQSKVATPRNEPDRVKILSGVFEGKTTGTSLAMIIENQDQDSSKYDDIKEFFRPGHADFSFMQKYGIRDHRGGGRSSGRETAARVAGGAVAAKILLDKGVEIKAYSLEIAGIRAETLDYEVIETNIVRCPDAEAAKKMEKAITDARKEGDSVGGIVELRIKGVPAGLGDPVFGKLDARLAGALCSLGAVKAIEFGDGVAAAKARASEFNDCMKDGKFVSNHAGGIIGGISTSQEIIVRLTVKPTPSITKQQQTCNLQGDNEVISIQGRHDPCIVPRIIPVVEAMAALVILDAWQIQQRINPNWQK